MGGNVAIYVGFAGALVFLGLGAWMVLRSRALPPGPERELVPPPSPGGAGEQTATTALSQAQMFAAAGRSAQARAQAPHARHVTLRLGESVTHGTASEHTGAETTEHVDREELLASVLQRADEGVDSTEHIDREEVLAAVLQRADADGDSTEHIDREELLAAALRRADEGVDSTEHIDREELLTAALRRADADGDSTEHIGREELLAAALRRADERVDSTEHIDREDLFAASSRAAEPVVAASAAPAAPAAARARAGWTPDPPRPQPAQPVTTLSHAAEPDLSDEVLHAHLEGALTAMQELLDAVASGAPELDGLIEDAEERWRSNVVLLTLTAKRVAEQILIPSLRDEQAPHTRRVATTLALLELKRIDATKRVLDELSTLDAAGHGAILDAFAHWADPRAEATILKALTAASSEHELAWLDVCIERNIAPRPAQLEALLASDDPERLARGLRLLALVPGEDEARFEVIGAHLFAGPAPVREAAILTGLTLGHPSASLISKQAARDPAMPLVCTLEAGLGGGEDVSALIEWAKLPSAPDHAGWALSLCGQLSALDTCVARLEHADPEVVEAALVGLRLATRFAGEAEDARNWWDQERGAYAINTRYLDGAPISPAGLRTSLVRAAAPLRRVLILELFVRSGGAIRIPLRQLPRAFSATLARLTDAQLEPITAHGGA